jgi:MinD-like ATPase involved in chromosome partitioning or flagellar assembly
MNRIISIHSFRGGTGKSNTAANISTLLAAQGLRIGVVDTDIQSPGIHVLFGLDEEDVTHSLNEYLYGKCSIADCAMDVTNRIGSAISGKIFLIPSSIRASEIARVIREGYDVGLLNQGFNDLLDELQLDALIIDTHPGLNDETLLSIAISDALLIILRPDSQDYQGTSVTVEVARKLDVPNLFLMVNKVPAIFNPKDVKSQVEQNYNAEVVGILSHSDEMMTLASTGIFVLRYPDHPITIELRKVAHRLMAES